MGDAVKFHVEWQEAPGVRDPLLAQTWARLELEAQRQTASELVDLRANSRRTGIYGSVFPLAEWLVENWWPLLYELSPDPGVRGARGAPPWMTPWMRRHNLLAAREGGALPDLTIARDGDDVLLTATPDPLPAAASGIRFVAAGLFREPAEAFERDAAAFIESTALRLAESLADHETVRHFLAGWAAVRASDRTERDVCRALAQLHRDPYDPSPQTAALVDLVERARAALPEPLCSDLFEGSGGDGLAAHLAWLEHECAGLRRDGRPAVAPPHVSCDPQPVAHEAGYAAARKVRAALLRVPPDGPLPDLAARLEADLGWLPGCIRPSAPSSDFDGLVGLDAATAAPVLVVPGRRSGLAERFRLARAAFFPATNALGPTARLLTASNGWAQRAARAFAAELLAPAAALAHAVGGPVGEGEVDALAATFEVHPLVIRHQLENHGLGSVRP